MVLNTNRNPLRWASLLGLVAALFTGSATQVSADEGPALTIGSKAPELNIEHWVSNGKGAFKPVTKFEKDKVYVVEFWATWCGPCVASMPHLVEMQTKFGKKVQIISISDEDLETVNGFLARDFKAQGGAEVGANVKTYGDLTSAYCLTADPDRSCHTSYMEAAGQNGIPCAFIVGKDQMIEYIGHPMQMDEALSKVLDGTWDRKAFAEEFQEQQKLNQAMSSVMRLARTNPEAAIEKINEVIKGTKSKDVKLQLTMMKVQLLAQSDKTKEALETIDSLIKDPANKEVKSQLQMMRVQLVLMTGDAKQIAETANVLYKTEGVDPQMVNFVAWSIVEQIEAGKIDDKALVKSSLAAVQGAVKKMEGDVKAAGLDTLSHLQYLDGDKAGALKTQEEAIASTSNAQLKAQLSEFLNKLKSESK